MKIKCIAVDDEPLALGIISEYARLVDFLDFRQGFDNPVEALSYLKSNAVDLVFLDIQMNQLTGIQLIQVLKTRPHIILTTAYEEYALKGYELDVVDYLLKPVSFERFIQSIEKVYEKMRLSVETAGREAAVIGNPRESYLFVKTGSMLKKIEFDDILYVEGMGEYLKIVTEKENVLTLQNFAKMGMMLPESNFVRVHKSFMVSLRKISSVERNRIYMKDKVIPVSDSYREKFFKYLEKRSV